MDTLAGMRLFEKAVEAGSFSAAGRALGLAPSSVARQITALETALGAQLLNRSTRKLSLTEAGALYHDHAHRILADVEAANHAVSSLRDEPSGTLRLNIPVVFGQRYIAPTLPEFLERYPEIRVDLQVTDHYVDMIEDGADLAIRIGGLTSASLIARKLVSVDRVLVASPAYVEKHGTPERPEDLTRHNCLRRQLHPAEDSLWEFEDGGGIIRVRVTGNLFSANIETINVAMLNGGGIALLPLWVAGKHIQRGEAAVLLPGWRPKPSHVENEVYAVYPHNRTLSAKVRAYIDFIAAKFREEPDFRVEE